MKQVFILVIVLAVLGGIAYYKGSISTYTAPEVKTVEKTVEVDPNEQAIKQAQEAKKEEIEAKAKKAYDEAYNQEMKKVELEVVKSINEKLDARQTQLEKDTKTY